MNVSKKQKRRFRAKLRFVLTVCALAFLATGFSGCKSVPSAVGQTPDPAAGRLDSLNRQADIGEIYADNEPPATRSIAIVRPIGRSLTENEQYILDMIKSSMNSNFIKFAQGRISVVNITDDEARAGEIDRSLSGSNDELSLTARTAARSLLTGDITKIPNTNPPRYNIDLRVTDTETSESMASYNKVHSDIEVIEGIAVNRATEDILRQLKVRLNEMGTQVLYASTNSNQGDIDLAKGLNAAKSGQNLEAMNYLFSASSFDTTASQAVNTLAAVQTKNEQELQGAGEIVALFFESQKLWQGRINEYNVFYRNHLPFELYYTKVSPDNMHMDSAGTGLYDLQFDLGLRWNQNQIDVMNKVLNEYILDELRKIQKEDPKSYDNYHLQNLPEEAELFRGRDNLPFELYIQVENENGAVIASSPVTLSASLYWHQEKIYADCLQSTTVSFREIPYVKELSTPNLYVRITRINGMDIQTAGGNGFMRVTQIQTGGLPRVQPSQMPYSLQSQVRQEIADEVQVRRTAALKNQYGTYITAGASFTPGAGFVNVGIEGLYKMALIDVGAIHYFGAGGEIKHTDPKLGEVGTEIGVPNEYSRRNFGGNFSASYAFRLLSDKWFLAAGLGGMIYHISVKPSSSDNKTLPDLYSEYAFIPYLKAQFYYPVGIVHLRLGYQVGLFNADTAGVWFNRPNAKGQLGDYLMWHSVYGGFSLML